MRLASIIIGVHFLQTLLLLLKKHWGLEHRGHGWHHHGRPWFGPGHLTCLRVPEVRPQSRNRIWLSQAVLPEPRQELLGLPVCLGCRSLACSPELVSWTATTPCVGRIGWAGPVGRRDDIAITVILLVVIVIMTIIIITITITHHPHHHHHHHHRSHQHHNHVIISIIIIIILIVVARITMSITV